MDTSSRLFVQGGMDYQSSILNDFWAINIFKHGSAFEQQTLSCSNFSNKSLCRLNSLVLYRHKAALIGEDKAVLFGGKSTNEEGVNSLYLFDRTDGWKASQITGGNLGELPALDSHGIVYVAPFLYVFGGFEARPKFQPSNKILRIDLNKSFFEEMKVTGRVPEPRMNFGYCLDGSNRLIIFGGANKNQKFKDLHRFDFLSKEWVIITSEVIEKVGFD